MRLEIPVEVDLNGIDDIVDEIKSLQTYKLSADDDMNLVSRDDVAEILINHIEAKRKSEPQRMRGKWILCTEEIDETFHTGSRCSECNYWKPMGIWNFCPNCGADMRERRQAYYQEHAEEIREKSRRNYYKRKEKQDEQRRSHERSAAAEA